MAHGIGPGNVLRTPNLTRHRVHGGHQLQIEPAGRQDLPVDAEVVEDEDDKDKK